MTPEERDLRRALEARSGEPSAEFRARLSAALGAGRPVARTTPALALVAAVCLAIAMVGVLLLARQGARLTPEPGPASAPRAQTPTPPLNCTFCPIEMPSYAQVSAPGANVVWALVAGQYLARSMDHGNTWEHRPLPGAISGYPTPEITFVNDLEGWFTSGGSPETQCNAETVEVWHTTDAGATWHSLGTKGVARSQCKGHPSFVDSNRGFLDAFDPNRAPVIYRTIDGGGTWTPSRPLPDPPGFKTIGAGFNLQPGLVRAFGATLLVPVSGWQESGTSVEYAFRSTDSGATWNYLARGKDPGNPIVFVTATRWLQLINPGQSFETTDAGASWHLYPSDYSQAAPIAPDIVFGDPLVGYATVRGSISITTDGGLHWKYIETPGTRTRPIG
jgi:photosystem II stability/assembly factor-like uncharacterized protein